MLIGKGYADANVTNNNGFFNMAANGNASASGNTLQFYGLKSSWPYNALNFNGKIYTYTTLG